MTRPHFSIKILTMRKLVPVLLIIIALAAGIYAGYVTARHNGLPKGPLIKINFLSADYGNGALIRTPNGKFILIDPGPRRTAAALITYLQEAGVHSLDVIVTNPTYHRAGSLDAIADQFKVRHIFRGENAVSSNECRRAFERVTESKIPQVTLVKGDRIRFSHSTKLEVLSPPPALLPRVSSSSDSNSLVICLSFKGKRFLYTSDAGEETETYLIKSEKDLENDVLVIPKYGKSGAASLEFLSRVRPEYCVVSCSGHISRSVLKRIDPKNTGADLFRTDKNGTISIISDGRSIITYKENDDRG